MHIAFITKTVGGMSPTGIIRVSWPMRWITKYTKHTVTPYTVDDLNSYDIGYSIKADVIVVHRLINGIQRILNQASENNPDVKVVYDTDDFEIGAWGKYSNVSWLFEFDRILEYMLDRCDLVTTASEQLKQTLRKYTTKPIEYLPNGFDFMHDVYHERHYDRDFSNPTIYWGGGTSHDRDIDLFLQMGVIDDIAERQNVMWKFHSISPEAPGRRAVKSSPVISEPAVNINDYIYELMRGATLAIAPLMTERYNYVTNELEPDLINQNRSELKIIEAGIACLPIVCSDVEPYRGHTDGVLNVANKRDSWVEAIEFLINHPEESKELGMVNRRYVEKKYNAYDITTQRIDLFKELL
jgi:glycosyltransferase involved in cell wall biosynthesis